MRFHHFSPKYMSGFSCSKILILYFLPLGFQRSESFIQDIPTVNVVIEDDEHSDGPANSVDAGSEYMGDYLSPAERVSALLCIIAWYRCILDSHWSGARVHCIIASQGCVLDSDWARANCCIFNRWETTYHQQRG